MERPTVLLAMNDASEYAPALQRAGFDTIDDPAQIQQRLLTGQPLDIAVLDCDADAAMLATVHAALHGGRVVPTLLLFSDELPDFEGSIDGDELAMKPIPADALVYRLQALLIRTGRQVTGESGWSDVQQDDQASIGEGHVVSVFAPKGGVGKTTIAVNLAVALREQTRERVLLLDADVGVGNVTTVLAAPQTMGLVGLADSTADEWTDAAFEQLVTVHAGSGVRILTWGSEPGDSERVSVDLMLAAVRWGRMHHAYVVIDNHPGYADRTMAMLTVSRETLLIVTPEVGPLRNASQFLDLFRQLGLGDTVQVVVNRANHGIRLADMAQSLGLPIAATIVSNGPKAVIAANEGTPIITKFPHEKISTDLHGVARLITRQQQEAVRQSGKRWWLPFASRATNA